MSTLLNLSDEQKLKIFLNDLRKDFAETNHEFFIHGYILEWLKEYYSLCEQPNYHSCDDKEYIAGTFNRKLYNGCITNYVHIEKYFSFNKLIEQRPTNKVHISRNEQYETVYISKCLDGNFCSNIMRIENNYIINFQILKNKIEYVPDVMIDTKNVSISNITYEYLITSKIRTNNIRVCVIKLKLHAKNNTYVKQMEIKYYICDGKIKYVDNDESNLEINENSYTKIINFINNIGGGLRLTEIMMEQLLTKINSLEF